jgi:hypothetical protein
MARRRAAPAVVAVLVLAWLPATAAGDTSIAYGPPADRFLAAWDDDGVRLRALDGPGTWAGGPRVLDDGEARSPDIAYNAVTNEFLVAWERDGAVHAARLGAYGEPLAEWRISDTGPAADPRVAAAEDGGYLVVWERSGAIAGQALDQLGLELGPDRDLARTSPSCRPRPFGACTPDVAGGAGGYLVAWHDDVAGDDYEDEIFAQRLTASALPAGPPAQASFAGYDPADAIFTQATDPVVAWDAATGEFIVAWEGFSSTPRGREQEIVAQRVGRDGAPAGRNMRVSHAPGGPLEVAPSDAEVSAGGSPAGVAAVWEERIGQGEGMGIAGGGLQWPQAFQWADAQNPALAYTGARREHLVLWQDAGGDVRAAPLPADPLGAG